MDGIESDIRQQFIKRVVFHLLNIEVKIGDDKPRLLIEYFRKKICVVDRTDSIKTVCLLKLFSQERSYFQTGEFLEGDKAELEKMLERNEFLSSKPSPVPSSERSELLRIVDPKN